MPQQTAEPEILCNRIERGGAVWAEIVLNRPEKGNALTMPMLRTLADHVSAIAGDRDVRALVLRGRGRFFCTGGDIAAWGALSPEEMARDWILPGIRVLDQIASLPQPVLAVLSGHALGGGLELALAADLRIAVESARLGAPEVALGMVSGWGGIRRMAEIAGVARARQLTLLGLPVTAAQALEWGLVHAVAKDAGESEEQLAAWLDKLCSNAPAAMALTKRVLASMHADLTRQHAAAAAEAAATEDCREGVRAFLEKRKPAFRNR